MALPGSGIEESPPRDANGRFVEGHSYSTSTQFQKGQPGYSHWTGKKMSDEHKAKISAALKGRPSNNPKGNGGATKGRKATPRQLEGLAHGKRFQPGENHPGWKGGVTEANWGFYRSHAYRKWRKAVIDRDGCCVLCGTTEQLQADHIKPRSQYPELGLDLDNGRCLCKPCHQETDTFAGRMHKILKEAM